MELQKKQVIGLLRTLGFSKAHEWDAESLTKRIAQIPSKVEISDIDPTYHELYGQLSKMRKDTEVQFVGPEPDPPPPPPPGQTPPEKKKRGKRSRFDLILDVLGKHKDEWISTKQIARESGLELEQVRENLNGEDLKGKIEKRQVVKWKLV